jgi:hypothetical protein
MGATFLVAYARGFSHITTLSSFYSERSHSGLVRTLGERMSPKGDRGFKSRPLRLRPAEAGLRRTKPHKFGWLNITIGYAKIS